MSFTGRLTTWVETRSSSDAFEGCRVTYRVSTGHQGSGARLTVQDERRFVELLLRDSGAAELAVGWLGDPGHGTYMELEDVSAVDALADQILAELVSWRSPLSR